MNKSVLGLFCGFVLAASCSCTGSASASASRSQDGEPAAEIPMFVRSLSDNDVLLCYWGSLNEPVLTETNADVFDNIHNAWAIQDRLRRNASDYTNLFLGDGTACKVKFRNEQITGKAGTGSNHTDIYAFREGQQTDHFYSLSDEGGITSCTFNGKNISAKEGQAYLEALPEFYEITTSFTPINQKY